MVLIQIILSLFIQATLVESFNSSINRLGNQSTLQNNSLEPLSNPVVPVISLNNPLNVLNNSLIKSIELPKTSNSLFTTYDSTVVTTPSANLFNSLASSNKQAENKSNSLASIATILTTASNFPEIKSSPSVSGTAPLATPTSFLENKTNSSASVTTSLGTPTRSMENKSISSTTTAASLAASTVFQDNKTNSLTNKVTSLTNLTDLIKNPLSTLTNTSTNPPSRPPGSIWYSLPRGFNQSDPDSILGIIAANNDISTGFPFKDVYVFGDSACDTGNLFLLNDNLDPNPGIYWKGRFSNGPMWPDYLQSLFNLRRTSYAFGGATVLNSNYRNGDDIPDFPRQINFYKQNNFNSARPLAILQFVGNDMIGKNVTSVQVATDIAKQLQILIDLGEIHNILILGTAVQAYVEMGFNTALKNMVQDFQSNHTKIAINFFPLFSLFKEMSINPPNTAETDKWYSPPLSCYNQITGSLCNDPGNYLLFDLYHPSTVPNFNIANYIGQAIRNLPWV